MGTFVDISPAKVRFFLCFSNMPGAGSMKSSNRPRELHLYILAELLVVHLLPETMGSPGGFKEGMMLWLVKQGLIKPLFLGGGTSGGVG